MNGAFDNMDFKTVIMITNQVFNKWGYSTLKKAKKQLKTIDGKRINITTDYIIEIDKDIYDNIIPHNYNENNSTIERPKGNDILL
jgi:queuine/archaeosine tRNA-ribosyltransferase